MCILSLFDKQKETAVKKIIGYCRVSTEEQGEKRNGLDAQRAEIQRWVDYNQYELVSIIEEVASGGNNDRPLLKAALQQAKKLKAKVVVSKLDRISRDAGYIRKLMHDTKQVVAIDIGEQADSFIEHIYAGLAEQERKMIGARTKAGLAATKARGTILGNRTNLPEAQQKGVEAIKAKADSFALKMKAPIQRMRQTGMTFIQIAQELNDMNIPTARGGAWQASTVHNLTRRWR